MAFKPWETREDLWKEKCRWGNTQNKAALVGHLAERTGKSKMEVLRDLKLAKQRGMLHTNDDDASVEIE